MLAQICFEFGQRPCGKPQAQVRGTGSGCFDNQLLYFAAMNSRATGPFAVVQSEQTIGLEAFHPFVSIRVMKVGDLTRIFDAVACGQLPDKKAPSVQTSGSARRADQPLQF